MNNNLRFAGDEVCQLGVCCNSCTTQELVVVYCEVYFAEFEVFYCSV
jgi:hypothetical protein